MTGYLRCGLPVAEVVVGTEEGDEMAQSDQEWLNGLDDDAALVYATKACRAVLLEL